jgi:hypothetical protein
MGQEFIIKSQTLEDKVNQLLPSQGGFQAGVDLSASTTIIPIVDLTESAEGSNLREDLQTAFSHTTTTSFNVAGATSTIINTTGYYRLVGTTSNKQGSSVDQFGQIIISDGVTDKVVWQLATNDTSDLYFCSESFDLTVKLEAGDSLKILSTNANTPVAGSVRQIADLQGNLINP